MLERGKMERGIFEIVDTESLVPEGHLLRKIDEAVDFFRGNIRDYTEDAKDKFIAKLERYKDE